MEADKWRFKANMRQARLDHIEQTLTKKRDHFPNNSQLWAVLNELLKEIKI